jgi:hypothetical protein
MSNIPMSFTHLIPIGFGAMKDKTIITHQGSTLSIDSDGEMLLDGSSKMIALGLVKYIIESEWQLGMISFELNHVLRIESNDNIFSIHYVKDNKPDFFDELVKDFNRVVNMKAFW